MSTCEDLPRGFLTKETQRKCTVDSHLYILSGQLRIFKCGNTQYWWGWEYSCHRILLSNKEGWTMNTQNYFKQNFKYKTKNGKHFSDKGQADIILSHHWQIIQNDQLISLLLIHWILSSTWSCLGMARPSLPILDSC